MLPAGGLFLQKSVMKDMKNNKLTPSEEDYVEMIYRINLNRGNVQVKDVANELNIKPASVTKMVKKLNDKDILEYKKYDYIKLTKMGYKLGDTLLKRHNTIYKFLEILGLKEDIHEETEKIEHTINYDTLEKINTLIDFFSNNEDVYSLLINFRKNREC